MDNLAAAEPADPEGAAGDGTEIDPAALSLWAICGLAVGMGVVTGYGPSGKTSGCYAGKADVAVAWQRGSGAIARAFERSGVNAPHKVERDGKATVHSLRHTFASWCLQKGLSLPEVQELLGHSDMSMTRRYAHLATGVTVERAKGVLGGIIAEVLTPTQEQAS